MYTVKFLLLETDNAQFPCLKLRSVKYFKDKRHVLNDAVELFPFRQDLNPGHRNHLFVERTLGESYYHGMTQASLTVRKNDQIVTQHAEEGSDAPKKPILVVPQLWIWQQGKTVLSAFASEYNGRRILPDTGDHNCLLRGGSPESFVGELIASQVREFGVRTTDCLDDSFFSLALSIFESAVVTTLDKVDNYMNPNIRQKIRRGEGAQIHSHYIRHPRRAGHDIHYVNR